MNQNNIMLLTFIIFLVIGVYILYNLNLNESFQDRNELLNQIKKGLSDKLGISMRRITNLNYTGNVEDNNLRVFFQVDKRNTMEQYEKTTGEINQMIQNLVSDGLFIIKIGENYVNVASTNDFNISSSNSNNNFNNNSNSNNNSNNNSSEQFQNNQYLRNYDPRFDNIDVYNAARFVMSKYRGVPFDPSVSEFIKLETQDGKLVAVPESRANL